MVNLLQSRKAQRIEPSGKNPFIASKTKVLKWRIVTTKTIEICKKNKKKSVEIIVYHISIFWGVKLRRTQKWWRWLRIRTILMFSALNLLEKKG